MTTFCDHGGVAHEHALDPNLDRRLLSYAALTWNSYEAVFAFQQLTALAPVYTRNLVAVEGRGRMDDARRVWGVVADLAAAMVAVQPTMESLVDLGFTEALAVRRLIGFGGDFALCGSPALQRMDFRRAGTGDIVPLLRDALAHDRIAKPLLDHFQDEIRAYDADMAAALPTEHGAHSFRELVRQLEDQPLDFPLLDGRPMFLGEQKALLDYLARHVGAEVVADALVDGPIGDYLLQEGGAVVYGGVTGELMFDVNRVPLPLLARPVELVSHQVGHAVLEALAVFDADADVLDQLYVIESTVRDAVGIDVSPALARTRSAVMEERVRRAFIIDLGAKARIVPAGGMAHAWLEPFEYPDLSEG